MGAGHGHTKDFHQQQRNQTAPEHRAKNQRQGRPHPPSKENEQQGQQQGGAAEHRIHAHCQQDIIKTGIDSGQLNLQEDRQNGQRQRNDGNPRTHKPGGEKRHIDISPAAGSSGRRFHNGMENFAAGNKQYKPGQNHMEYHHGHSQRRIPRLEHAGGRLDGVTPVIPQKKRQPAQRLFQFFPIYIFNCFLHVIHLFLVF